MKVRVEPEVEAGTNRGGEDLLLAFTAYHDGDTPPVNEDVVAELAVADDYDASATVTSGEYDAETDKRYWSTCTVKYRSCHYEFEWEGTGSDALKLALLPYCKYLDEEEVTVEQYLRDPESWHFCHKPGESPRLTCHCKVFVHGNAD